MIDLPPQDLTTIKRVLAKHVPDCEVRAFGSRVTWTAKPHSDFDLVVVGKDKLPRSLLSTLKGEFEDSAIPVTVDLIDWHRISGEFQKNITKQYETIQHAHEGKSIPEGWAYRKVAEFAEVIGGGTPKSKNSEYWGGDIPWLTPKDLSGEHPRYVSRGGRSITKTGLENSGARIVPPKTVLLTCRAPVGYVALAKNPLTTNQGFRNLVVNDENDPEFVYYLLLNNSDYLRQHVAGATLQQLSGSTLKSLEFLMPPLPEQKAIARILGTLDDKIELNRRMNETLEGIARAIFKSWFVDFDPVRAKAEGRDTGLPKEIEDLFPDSLEDSELGKIPKGWKAVPATRIFDVNPRVPLSKGSIAPYVDMKALPTNGFSVTDVITKEFKGGSKFQQGDVLLACITPYLENGKTGVVDFFTEGEVGFGSTEFIVLRGDSVVPTEFAYCLARDKRFRRHCIASIVGSSGRQRVQTACFDQFMFAKAPDALLSEFANRVHSSFGKIAENFRELSVLAGLRDRLLPGLLSGAVPVLPRKEETQPTGRDGS